MILASILFINKMAMKIKELDLYQKQNDVSFHIEVDGGINEKTGKLCKENGADYLVAGSFITGSSNYRQAIDELCK